MIDIDVLESLKSFELTIMLETTITWSVDLLVTTSSLFIEQSTLIQTRMIESQSFVLQFGSAITITVVRFEQNGATANAVVTVSGVTVVTNAATLQSEIIATTNIALVSSVEGAPICATPCVTVVTSIVTVEFQDSNVETLGFTMTAAVKTTIQWSADLTDETSAVYIAQKAAIESALSSSSALSEQSIGFRLAVRLVRFRLVTTSGRKRSVDETVAEVEYSGETDIGESAALEQVLLAATDEAAGESALLETGTELEEAIVINLVAGSAHLIPSLTMLCASLLFMLMH